MVPRQSFNQDGCSVCPGHDQFEARIDDKFDSLKETMERAVGEMAGMRQDLAAIYKALSDGRVEFKAHEGRINALEKTTQRCESDRTGLKDDIKALQRAYWMMAGGLTVLQVAIQLAVKFWKV